MRCASTRTRARAHSGGKLWAYLVLSVAGMSQGASVAPVSDYINPHASSITFINAEVILEVSTVELERFMFVRTLPEYLLPLVTKK